MSEDLRELARRYAEACVRAHACARAKGEVSPAIRSALTRAFGRVWEARVQNNVSIIEFGELLREEQRKAQST